MILKNGKRIDGASIDTTPIGSLSPFLGLVAPEGYLLCQGQKVSKTRYNKLYEICGDLFGTSTTDEFYLPDLRGKTIVGYNSSDTSMNTIGKLLGSATHTHDIAHTHGVPGVAHTHTTGNHTLTVAEMPNHNHPTTSGTKKAVAAWSWQENITGFLVGDSVNGYPLNEELSTGGGQAHNHGNTGSTTPNATTTSSQSSSTSGSGTNYQPSFAANWMVKAEMVNYIGSKVYNGLDSDSATDALSAKQGKVLSEKIDTNISTLEQTILNKGYITKTSLPLTFEFRTSSGGDTGLTEFKNMLTTTCPIGITAWHIIINGVVSAALVQKASNSYLSFIYWGYATTASQQKYVNGTWTSVALAQ